MKTSNIRETEGFDPKRFCIALNQTENDNTLEKNYLPVKARLRWANMWANENKLKLSILTRVCSELSDNEKVTFICEVVIQGEVIAVGHGSAMYASTVITERNIAIEQAETRSVGRALANAGFVLYDEFDKDVLKENAPCDGFPPNTMNPVLTPSTFEDEKQNTSSTSNPVKTGDEKQLMASLCAQYPFSPWKGTRTYELLEQGKLLSNLNWIKDNYEKGKKHQEWATFLLSFLEKPNEYQKQIYLNVRETLRKEGKIQ